MSAEVDSAFVALVVAVVALLVASAQLTAQIFATAEGARKCSYAVLGEWSISEDPKTKTIFKRRWREGRLETMFVVPEISLSSDSPAILSMDNGRLVIAKNRAGLDSGDQENPPEAVLGGNSALDKLLYGTAYEKYSPDRVGWISFLAFVRVHVASQALSETNKKIVLPQSEIAEHDSRGPKAQRSNRISWPKIKYIQRSWDFMPPDAPKPLASSTVGDIAILARRCGMIWTDFKPDEGIMRAGGGPHTITSMDLRMGIVLRYRCLDGSLRKKIKKHLKTKGAERRRDGMKRDLRDLTTGHLSELEKGREDSDPKKGDEASNDEDQHTEFPNWGNRFGNWVNEDKIMFGLVPSDPALDIPDFPHATKEECWDTLAELSNDKQMRKRISGESWLERYEFNDLLLMAPECLRQRGMCRYQWRTTRYYASVFFFTEWAFTELLTRYLDGKLMSDSIKLRTDEGTDQMKHVLQVMKKFEKMDLNHIPDLEELHDHHEATTAYFRDKREKGLTFYALLKAHFNQAPRFSCRALAECSPGRGQYGSLPPSSGNNWRNKNMELYFLNLPDVIAVMRDNGCEDEDLVIEAWLTLMLRAFLFMKLHGFSDDMKGGYLPRKYYCSRIPVWLE